MRWLGIALITVLTWCAAGTWAGADGKLYRKVVPSTVAFSTPNGAALGSGVVVDADKKLVVTAYHVIDAAVVDKEVRLWAFFPMRDKERIVRSAHEYALLARKNRDGLLVKGKVIAFDPIKDLALVELDSVPAGTAGIPLAKEDPEPGDSVHVIGNSTGGRGGLFGYNTGFVRNDFLHGQQGAFCFYALCHQAPTNRGDSGGPVVNDEGELVAVISHGTTGSGSEREQVVDYSVHVKEIRAFLERKNTYKKPCVLPTAGSPVSYHGNAFAENQADSVLLRARSSEGLQIDMRGNAQSDLDLFVDPGLSAFPTIAETGNTDREKVALKVDWTGVARITVRNFHTAKDREAANQQKQNLSPLTRVNQYSVHIGRSKHLDGPVTVLGTLAPQATAQWKLHYEAGKGQARITLYGEGNADVDLFVVDPQGKEVGRSDTYESRETVTWTPGVTGIYTILVENISKLRKGQDPRLRTSRFFLLTD